jgi:predicted transcriptional regulator
MNKHLKVEGHSNLVRDSRTGAILNTNRSEIDNARKRDRIYHERQNQIESLTKDVRGLKEDMSQIKDLLLKLAGNANE